MSASFSDGAAAETLNQAIQDKQKEPILCLEVNSWRNVSTGDGPQEGSSAEQAFLNQGQFSRL